ncbi:branched-chain amino acid aminotransferase [Phenylobacterium zucineum HLK1]|uniref:Branched-chain-amino-acid aminotransferase n=1 Tax=Phenylobacterium zucineum (strain HLK1) TaxID=450851 RepID=B4RFV9_PHEZH|nr:branched-chain amino acid aminotransferase [Phenylobacterium zucineum]ACG78772.1 branched-chain amino acid aminotransferase [Phenylobacterium zucineum HLK1]
MQTIVERHPGLTPPDRRAELLREPGFGKVFTDHMAMAWWRDGEWTAPRITPRRPLALDPAAAVLHYAQEIFEGMKAYRTEEGEVLLFRPEVNAKRFARSAERMAMPQVPEALFSAAVEALIRTDRDWIPSGEGSLYLRPFMIATEAFLGVRPATEYLFCVLACPVGAYFKGGAKPVTVWASTTFTRAAAGGTGAAKCGGNYAGSLIAQAEAIRHGCDQVVFLDAAEHRWIEELGGMNVFFLVDGTLITPPLTGTILEGVTRSSLLTLAREEGLKVEERPYDFETLKADAASGRLTEAFACGTAAVVAAIGEVRHAAGAFAIAGGVEGPVTSTLRRRLTDIQRGQAPDPHGWTRRVQL